MYAKQIFLEVKVFARKSKTIFFASLVRTVRICSSQVTFLSNITPKNFIANFFSILLSAIFKASNFKSRSSLADFL